MSSRLFIIIDFALEFYYRVGTPYSYMVETSTAAYTRTR